MSKRQLTVTGKGTLKVSPDWTRISFSMEGLEKEYDNAVQSSNIATKEVKTVLATLGFEAKDVKTLSFKVQKEEEAYKDLRGNWKSRFVGYKYRHNMKIEFPNDNTLLGKILYQISHLKGIDSDFQISYFIRDMESAKNSLLANAVQDARNKANILAQAAGVELKEILSINYSWQNVELDLAIQPFGAIQENLQFSQDAYDVDIEPDDIDIEDTVTLIWKME